MPLPSTFQCPGKGSSISHTIALGVSWTLYTVRSSDMANPVGSLSWKEPCWESLNMNIETLLVPGATLTTELIIS